MAEAQQNKLYSNFVRGLITEATPLTYPENATTAEDNLVISPKGNRYRRLGVQTEPSPVFHPISGPLSKSDIDPLAVSEFRWESPANQQGLNFLVQQLGLRLYFFDMANQDLSASYKSFSVDLTPYIAPTISTTTASMAQVSMTSGKGYLFVAGATFEPILIEYDPVADSVTNSRIFVTMRDFTGLNDGLANDQEPTTLSIEHNYNLLNQGWFDPTS